MRNGLIHISCPVSVNIEITDKCNLGCFFCFNHFELSPAPGGMNPEEIRENLFRILAILSSSGVMEVRFFGGEFTIFKYWREILIRAKELGFFISFVSNGYAINCADVELSSLLV